jgi:hypothetical protein
MDIDRWINGYKVRSFPWTDGKTIYFNVQYFTAGQSVEQPPVFDKTVYITDNEAGKRLISDFINSLVDYVARMTIQSGTKVVITA